MHAQVIEVLTPCFCRGWDGRSPEWRVASIRGQLHWWARMLIGCGQPEFTLLGGVQETLASTIRLRLVVPEPHAIEDNVLLCPHDRSKGRGMALKSGSKFTLQWETRTGVQPDREQDFRRVLKAWCLLGGLGARSNRAAGSVWPVFGGGDPTPAGFMEIVATLGLPADVRVEVLPNPQGLDAKDLRRVATNTVNGLRPGVFQGDPLGCIGRNSRKASPFKLKVGRFQEDDSPTFRLIAVWDNRNGRGGDFAAALASMRERHKPLAAMIDAVGWP